MKTVIEMAREAAPNCHNEGLVCFDHLELERFAELVRADEREACARLAERSESGLHCAFAIRARSNT